MLHAPMQKESQLFELGCGTRFAQTSPRPIYDAVLSRCIPLLHLTSSNSLTLGIVHASMTLLSLTRDFLAIATI